MLHLNTIDRPLLKVLEDFSKLPELAEFSLVGGTSLALQFGHRKSDDLDFFTDKSFSIQQVTDAIISYNSSVRLMDKRSNGLSFIIEFRDTSEPSRKIDIYNWAVKFIRPFIREGVIRLASPEDIAAFKLDAICSRKQKKDYVDLAILLRKFSFEQMMGFYRDKFPYADQRTVLSQITNLEELEKSMDPVMLIDLDVSKAAKEVEQKALEYGKLLLNRQKERENKRNEKISDFLNRKGQKDDAKKGKPPGSVK